MKARHLLLPPPPKKNRNLKKVDTLGTVKANVLRDLPISRNQAMKSADDRYILILKNKYILDEIRNKKKKKFGLCELESLIMYVCSYLCEFIFMKCYVTIIFT